MPRNSSGNYQSPASSWNPAINGSLATAGDWNVLLADLSAALTDSLSRGGNGSMSANLNMGNNRITNLAAGTGTGDAVAWQQLFGVGTMADIASAATVDIGVQNTSFLRVTGTTTITSFGSNFRGPRFITFEGSLTLTNSSTLVLPGGANITTAAGDSLIVIPGATAGTADKWVVVAYQKNIAQNFVSKTSDVGAAVIPNGTTAQRPTSVIGQFRFNTTLGKFEGYNGTAWGAVGGGATGGGSDDIFVENGQTVTTNYTLTTGKNAMSAGPITINDGITVTVPDGSTWTVV